MIRRFVVLCGFLAACSSNVTTPGDTAAEPCTASDQCRSCGSCEEACLCGGGTEARCALTCSKKLETPLADAGVPEAAAPRSSLSATLMTDVFEIGPGEEMVRCQSFPNPFDEDVAVTRVESYMTAGSHHMFVFTTSQSTAQTELAECSGLTFGPNLHLAQRSREATSYPPGIGRIFKGTEGLQLQVHYFNASEDPVRTEVAVSIYAEHPDDVPIKAGQIFMNTSSISVPPFSKGSATKKCPVGKDINMLSATSHMHQNGVYYSARSTDGQLLYETREWAEPPPWIFETPRKLKGTDSIEIHCDYENHNATSLGFGESAATDEMCIFAGNYYPWEPVDDLVRLGCLF